MRLRKPKKTTWQQKQELAAPSRFYGDDKTWHRTTFLDVETHDGKVVAVWFRCQRIAFQQYEVDEIRATELRSKTAPMITGVQIYD